VLADPRFIRLIPNHLQKQRQDSLGSRRTVFTAKTKSSALSGNGLRQASLAKTSPLYVESTFFGQTPKLSMPRVYAGFKKRPFSKHFKALQKKYIACYPATQLPFLGERFGFSLRIQNSLRLQVSSFKFSPAEGYGNRWKATVTVGRQKNHHP
jgi:hypothetical protein